MKSIIIRILVEHACYEILSAARHKICPESWPSFYDLISNYLASISLVRPRPYFKIVKIINQHSGLEMLACKTQPPGDDKPGLDYYLVDTQVMYYARHWSLHSHINTVQQ